MQQGQGHRTRGSWPSRGHPVAIVAVRLDDEAKTNEVALSPVRKCLWSASAPVRKLVAKKMTGKCLWSGNGQPALFRLLAHIQTPSNNKIKPQPEIIIIFIKFYYYYN